MSGKVCSIPYLYPPLAPHHRVARSESPFPGVDMYNDTYLCRCLDIELHSYVFRYTYMQLGVYIYMYIYIQISIDKAGPMALYIHCPSTDHETSPGGFASLDGLPQHPRMRFGSPDRVRCFALCCALDVCDQQTNT